MEKTVVNALGVLPVREYVPPAMMTFPMECFELRNPANALQATSYYQTNTSNSNVNTHFSKHNVVEFAATGSGTSWKNRIYIPAGVYFINLLARMNGGPPAGDYALYIDNIKVGVTIGFVGNANNYAMVTRCFSTNWVNNVSGYRLVEIRDVLTTNPHYPYVSAIAFVRKS